MIAQNITEANRKKVMSAPMSVLSQLTHDNLREHYDVKSLRDRKGLYIMNTPTFPPHCH